MRTNRLILRSAKKSDAKDLLEFFNSSYVQKYNVMREMTLVEFESVISESEDLFIELIDTGEVIGSIAIEPDRIRARVQAVSLSYWLGEKYANKGYMSEALIAIVDSLQNYAVISARVFSDNIASQKLLEKLGFEREGYLKHAVRDFNDIIHDDILYAKINPEAK